MIIEAFRLAGLQYAGELRELPQDRIDSIWAVIQSDMAPKHPRFKPAYWKGLFRRCCNIIRRVQDGEADDYVPDAFMCPLSHDWYEDPVVAPSGISYSRLEIEEYLSTKEEDPVTREPLLAENLVPNRALRDATEFFRRKHRRFRIMCMP